MPAVYVIGGVLSFPWGVPGVGILPLWRVGPKAMFRACSSRSMTQGDDTAPQHAQYSVAEICAYLKGNITLSEQHKLHAPIKVAQNNMCLSDLM